jgi:hypothetical protein
MTKYGGEMRKMIFVAFASTLLAVGCGRLREGSVDREYSGFPRTASKEKTGLFFNTSLCVTTDEVLNIRPCAMTTKVSESFYRGYQDSIYGRKVKLFGKDNEYQSGYELGEDDKKSRSSVRKIEVSR